MRTCRSCIAGLILTLGGWLGTAPQGGVIFAADAADPRRPAEIETQDVPVIPDELATQLRQYQNTRAAVFQGWAPSGKGILIGTRFGDSAQVHRVYEPGGRREQLTFRDEPVSGGFLRHDARDRILLSYSRGGDENYQVELFEPQRFQSQRLTDGQSRNSIQAIRADGLQLIVGSNRRNGRDTDLYRVDLNEPDKFELIFETDREFWSARDWSPDQRYLLLARYVSANESYFALLDLETRKRIDLPLSSEEKAAIGVLAFSHDGRAIYIATDGHSEFRRLARFDLATRKYEFLTADIDWDVDELDVEPRSGAVAFTVNADGASRLFVWEAGQRREIPIPLGILASLEFSPDGQELGFTLARPESPADAYSLRVRDGKLTRWTFSETGGLDPARFVRPTRIQFPSFDSRMIPAYYYRPVDLQPNEKLPVLLNIHGGPEGQYQPFFSGPVQMYVNEMRIAVIFPNVRGSAGYGKTYLKLDNALLREDSVKDIGALLDWIERQPELDAQRVAVTGGSYGGYMVLASLTHYPDRIKAGVDIVGIANFITFLEKTAAYRQDLRRAEYGDERDPEVRSFFERISPTSNAHKIGSALLVAHGKNDPRVPFYEAEQIAAKVRDLGRPVWTVFAANEGHGFAKKPNADYLRAVEAMFLKQYLAVRAGTGPHP